MVAAGNTFINDILENLGFSNVFGQYKRYPTIGQDEIIQSNPDIVLLASEPYRFESKDLEEFQKLLPYSNVLLVDGEMFSWYGSRLIHACDYFGTFLEEIGS